MKDKNESWLASVHRSRHHTFRRMKLKLIFLWDTIRFRHSRVTWQGFTHWSSGPGNYTFDPSCLRCRLTKYRQVNQY